MSSALFLGPLNYACLAGGRQRCCRRRKHLAGSKSTVMAALKCHRTACAKAARRCRHCCSKVIWRLEPLFCNLSKCVAQLRSLQSQCPGFLLAQKISRRFMAACAFATCLAINERMRPCVYSSPTAHCRVVNPQSNNAAEVLV